MPAALILIADGTEEMELYALKNNILQAADTYVTNLKAPSHMTS
jgi:hypothetical protein